MNGQSAAAGESHPSRAGDRSMPARRSRWFDGQLLVRLAALGLAVVLFYSWDWLPLRESLRQTIDAALRRVGHQTQTLEEDGKLLLSVDGNWSSLTPDCTYVDLALIMAPFCWRTGRGWLRNVLRLVGLVVVVFAVNWVRVFAALHFASGGRSWFWVHDFPDMVIYWPSLALAILVALRHDRRRSATPNSIVEAAA